MPVQISKRLLTVNEYHQMGEAGILREKGIELINGEIVEMSPIGSRHAACVNRLNAILNAVLDSNVIISIQNPLITSDLSEPEPDVSVLKFQADFYSKSAPTAKDVLLVIEVADSSAAYDRTIKLPLYAESGIPEFWLIDLENNQIEAYWQPIVKAYKFRELLLPGDTLKAQHFELAIPVAELLG